MRQQLPAAEQQALTDAQCRHWKQGRLRQMPRHRASLVLPPAAMLGQLQERCGPVTKPMAADIPAVSANFLRVHAYQRAREVL